MRATPGHSAMTGARSSRSRTTPIRGISLARHYDYDDVTAGVAWRDRLFFSATWSPNMSIISTYGIVPEPLGTSRSTLTGRLPVVQRLSLVGGVGYYDLSELAGRGYWYGSAGLAYDLQRLHFDISWVQNSSAAREIFYGDQADNRWVGTVVWTFLEPPARRIASAVATFPRSPGYSRHPCNRLPLFRPRPSRLALDERERELLACVALRDRQAFEELYVLYHRPLARFLMRMSLRYELAEEVINDTFWVVWRQAAALSRRLCVSRRGSWESPIDGRSSRYAGNSLGISVKWVPTWRSADRARNGPGTDPLPRAAGLDPARPETVTARAAHGHRARLLLRSFVRGNRIDHGLSAVHRESPDVSRPRPPAHHAAPARGAGGRYESRRGLGSHSVARERPRGRYRARDTSKRTCALCEECRQEVAVQRQVMSTIANDKRIDVVPGAAFQRLWDRISADEDDDDQDLATLTAHSASTGWCRLTPAPVTRDSSARFAQRSSGSFDDPLARGRGDRRSGRTDGADGGALFSRCRESAARGVSNGYVGRSRRHRARSFERCSRRR